MKNNTITIIDPWLSDVIFSIFKWIILIAMILAYSLGISQSKFSKDWLKSKTVNRNKSNESKNIAFFNLPFDLSNEFPNQKKSNNEFLDNEHLYILALVPKENKNQIVLRLVSGKLDEKIYRCETRKLSSGDRLLSVNFLPDPNNLQGKEISGATKIAKFLDKLPKGKNEIKVIITYNGSGKVFYRNLYFHKSGNRNFVENAEAANNLFNMNRNNEKLLNERLPEEFTSNNGRIKDIPRLEIENLFLQKYADVEKVLGMSLSENPAVKDWYIKRNEYTEAIINMNSKAIYMVFQKANGKYYYRSYVLIKTYLGGGNYSEPEIVPLSSLGYDKEIMEEHISFR